MNSTQFVVQIESWDWPLHVGVKPRAVVDDLGRDGDLLCSEAIVIDGLILSPQEHAAKSIQCQLYPLPREAMFDGSEKRDVGRLHRKPIEGSESDFYASLFLPADTLHSAIVCLGSKCKASTCGSVTTPSPTPSPTLDFSANSNHNLLRSSTCDSFRLARSRTPAAFGFQWWEADRAIRPEAVGISPRCGFSADRNVLRRSQSPADLAVGSRLLVALFLVPTAGLSAAIATPSTGTRAVVRRKR